MSMTRGLIIGLGLMCGLGGIAAAEAPEQPAFEGATLPGDPALRPVAGPYDGLRGWTAAEGAPQRLNIEAERPVGEQGAVMLWVRLDRARHAGAQAESMSVDLFDVPGQLVSRFKHGPASLDLVFNWKGDGAPWLAASLPGLPGPAWYHLAVRWDAGLGVAEAFLNGTPLRLPGVRVEPWTAEPESRLKLAIAPFAVAGLRVMDRPFTDMELQREVPVMYRGLMDRVLGAQPLGTADLAARRGEALYENPLASEADLAEWVQEGPVQLSFDDGWMTYRSKQADGPGGHTVLWSPEVFPDGYLAEWDVQVTSEHGLCIVFFSAQGQAGKDLFAPSLAPRDGTFKQYTQGDIDAYHISYHANTPNLPGRATSNMRRNAGFHLVANGPPGIAPGSNQTHHVMLMKDGERITLTVDDRLVIDHRADERLFGPALGGGRIGLRQMQWTRGKYRNFRVSSLKPE